MDTLETSYTNTVEGSVVAIYCNEGLIPEGQMNLVLHMVDKTPTQLSLLAWSHQQKVKVCYHVSFATFVPCLHYHMSHEDHSWIPEQYFTIALNRSLSTVYLFFTLLLLHNCCFGLTGHPHSIDQKYHGC